MVNSIVDVLGELNFYELHKLFLDSSYYEFLFPFLLAYALFFTVLSKVSIFKSKKTGEPIKSVIVVISTLVAFYGISFEISDGVNVGNLLMSMFPGISALTIGILTLYIVAAMFGEDVFNGLFRKDHTAYLYIAVGVIGLGSVIYYVGIAMGFWKFDSIGPESQWNTIIAIALLILGVVFMFIDMIGYGLILLMVFGAFIYNAGAGNILEYFVDPVIFIIVIIIVLVAWLNSDKEEKQILEDKLKASHMAASKLSEKELKGYNNRIADISNQSHLDNLKKYRKKYGKEWSSK